MSNFKLCKFQTIKVAIFTLLIAMLPTLTCATETAETATTNLDIDGKAYVLLEPTTGEIIAENNADEKIYPASTTKIMTLTLALEAVAKGTHSLDEIVTTSAYAASMGGSQVFLYEGEQRTLEEMIIGIAVGSGNDASMAVAEHIGGSLEGFVEMMNQKAAELGMTGTNYANPHGLHDDNHYTTAHDMAILGTYALTVPKLLEYTSIYEYEFRPEPNLLILWNTNKLLKWYEGTEGLKTGYTDEAGRNLICTVVRDDLRLLSVVMGVPEQNGHFTETMELMNYGFNNYEFELIQNQGDFICQVPVEKSAIDTIDAITSQPVGFLKSKGETAEYTSNIVLNENITAPLNSGDEIGILEIYENEIIVDTIPLVSATTAEKISIKDAWIKILKSTLCLT